MKIVTINTEQLQQVLQMVLHVNVSTRQVHFTL